MTHKFPYDWTLKDANFTKDRGTVFSCFSCGGGSTMGYKLAGFDVIGCNEIDPKMMGIYKANHNPKFAFLEGIQTFAERDDYPEELYSLDILDGSPPCSSFSMSGSREDGWGQEKKFKEGQAEQVLDTLFFDFIKLAKKLQPKVIIAENVKGLLLGAAQTYVNEILLAFADAGYKVDYKLLKGETMGVPQRRHRVFFYAIRNDISCDTTDLFMERPWLDLEFSENEIAFSTIRQDTGNSDAVGLSIKMSEYWKMTKPGHSFSTAHPKGSYFNEIKTSPDRALPTLRASGLPYDYITERTLFTKEVIFGGTFPEDYNFLKIKPEYIIGMSVPPVMTAHIADAIYEQWLKGTK